MNLNRALIILFGFLTLLLVVTAIQVNRSKSNRVEFVIAGVDDEILIINTLFVPEVIRSYKNIKNEYVERTVLIFRYDKNSCSSCTNTYLDEILSLQDEIGKEYIWIFPAYPDERGTRIQLSNELAKYNYRNIPVDSLFIPTYHGEHKSYFAWINSDGEIDMVFIPDVHKPQYTHSFFQEVKQKLKMIDKH